MTHVYSLIDPRNNRWRYIGITCDFVKRSSDHRKDTESNTLKSMWVKELASEGKEPIMRIFESYDDREEAKAKEVYWIRFFRKKGLDLLNMTNGGECHAMTPERKEQQSKFMKELWKSPGYKEMVGAKISKKMKGRKPAKKTTDAARKKHSIAIIDNFGTIYQSTREASRILGIDRSSIRDSIKHGYINNKIYRFWRLNGCP